MKQAPVLTGVPLPEHSGPVLYILDARSGLERRLLEMCLAEAMQDARRLRVNLAEGKRQHGIDALQSALDGPPETLLVPVRIAWSVPGMDSGANQPLALRHLVFGDPRRPGPVRSRWILRRDPSRARCMSGSAATLSELRRRFNDQEGLSAEEAPSEFAAFVARQAGLALEIAEWGMIGRRYKAPRFVAESLRRSPAFRAAVRRMAGEMGRPAEDLYREAARYMKELIAVPNALFIDLRARFDNFILSLGYGKGVVCRDADLERLRGIVQSRPAMLLFTHKTYIDSVALTAKLFEKDFPMLHLFGGINMSFAGLGLLMRRSGGIFIRRSFQDKPLYKVVLRHYIGYLMEKRFPMTWSFEGTRSRTGKLMPPRYGLLKYVLEAAHATDARDIHVIPVAVSYDLMRDVEEYATEQTGRVKKPESLTWFLGYLSSLRRPMGRMYLDFGEPVVLEKAPEPDDALALSKVAFEVAVQANRVTPITLPAIACMVLLGAAPRALTLRELQRQILRHVRWARDRDIRLTSDFSADRLGEVRDLADAMVEMRLLIRYDEGPETVFGIEPDAHPVASYYRNTIIHHFVNKALLEMALAGVADRPAGQRLAAFWPETECLRDYFKFEFFYPDKTRFTTELQAEMTRGDASWEERLESNAQGAVVLLQKMRPLVAHASLLPIIEGYSVVYDLLARLETDETLEESECVIRALKLGKQAYLQRRITSEASIGKILFANGYRLARNLGLTEPGPRSAGDRARLLADFKGLSRRLDRIRLMSLSENPDR